MHKLFIKIAFIGIVASFIGVTGLLLSEAFDSSSDTKAAYSWLIGIGVFGLLLFVLRLLWILIKRMVYDLFYSASRGLKDGKHAPKSHKIKRKRGK
jgi:hypothetical protein